MPSRPTRPTRTAPEVTQTLGQTDKQSRQKASKAAERAVAMTEDPMPLAADGHPLTMIEISAAELIPHGQYANVSVGPARIRHWIDARVTGEIPDTVKANIAQALNQLAEVAAFDVIGVQRTLVLESLQSQVEQEKNGNK
jgi:hypothetical protein